MSDQIKQLIINQLVVLSKIKIRSNLLEIMHEGAIQELRDESKKSNPIVLDNEYFEKMRYLVNDVLVIIDEYGTRDSL